MEIYHHNLDSLERESNRLLISDRRISAARLFTLLATGFMMYQGYQTGTVIFYIIGIIALIAFFLLIKKHQSIRWLSKLIKSKIEVNKNELDFMAGKDAPFESGEEFIQHDHSYAYDLDFFGKKSIFQMLNRTGTVRGKQILADSLLNIQHKDMILQTQEAVKELTPLIDWRQQFLAIGSIDRETTENFHNLMKWSSRPPVKEHTIIKVLSFVIPATTLIFLLFYLIQPLRVFGNIAFLLFLINLGILGISFRAIREELIPSTNIEAILRHYSLLLELIENQSFSSSKLKALQKSIMPKQIKASVAIHHLSLLFGRMEHVANVFASPLLNGFLQYHIHVLRGFSQWRRLYGSLIHHWLDTVGEFEKLNSLAGFSFNHPEFIFPAINMEYRIKLKNVGHPLLKEERAITNSVDFSKNRFFILTGSNMSGKSTFLRTLGVNMVLAGIGAPVFSKKADIHPLKVLVSMRLSDSLSDSESYFYAEVKRLKNIMDQLNQQPCFVLLDEILRGTNSDDKRNGTMEVVRKMVKKKAFGGIATHDLEVCKITNEYPEILANKRFEVEIVNDELVFDYQLRDGVCENKSASFIMKKMGVI
ncbi:MAG: DNA mismatch repair protein [Bacteroidota bacterium]